MLKYRQILKKKQTKNDKKTFMVSTKRCIFCKEKMFSLPVFGLFWASWGAKYSPFVKFIIHGNWDKKEKFNLKDYFTWDVDMDWILISLNGGSYMGFRSLRLLHLDRKEATKRKIRERKEKEKTTKKAFKNVAMCTYACISA